MEDAPRSLRRTTDRPKNRRTARNRARRRVLEQSVRPSPAREHAPEPAAWLPLPDLGSLPELEDLLKPENLVDSGQTIAIRMRARDPQPFEEPPHVHRTRVAAVVADVAPEAAVAPEPQLAAVVPITPAIGARRTKRRRHHNQRVRMLVLAALIVVALVVLPLVFLPHERTVRLVVDGTERTVHSRGATVAEVVRNAGVWIGPYDRVTPALGASVPGGEAIRVLRAHPVVVDVDGDVRTEWVVANDVAALRDELKIDAALEVTANAEFVRSAAVVFRSRLPIVLTADGQEQPISTTARTVGELLNVQGVALGGADTVNPARESLLTANTRVVVTRVAGTERVEDRPIARGVVRRNDASLAAGTQKIVDAGADGLARVHILSVTHNGAVAEERVVRTEVITAARPQVIAVGTKSAPRSAPRATPPAPTYTRSETGGATWYSHIPGTCAHRTLPKGTVVRVTNLATGAATTCVVADRGPFVAGRIIDLTPDVFARIGNLSDGVIPVRVDAP